MGPVRRRKGRRIGRVKVGGDAGVEGAERVGRKRYLYQRHDHVGIVTGGSNLWLGSIHADVFVSKWCSC
jgi:hypothetical protein